MNTVKISTAVACSTIIFLLTSCQETDVESPSVCTAQNTANSVLSDEIEAQAGGVILLEDTFCDNVALSEVRWDIHNAADHAHEEGEEGEGLVLHSGTDWEVLEITTLEGTVAATSLSLDIPLSVRGVWDVVVSLVDAEGNAATDVVTQLHIENDYIPAFVLSEVDGSDPSYWGEEPVWSAGSDITVSGAVMDDDGVASASLVLIWEETEAVLWEIDLEADGSTDMLFQAVISIPVDISGECHFEMKAIDNLGNETETGFHVEVE